MVSLVCDNGRWSGSTDGAGGWAPGSLKAAPARGSVRATRLKPHRLSHVSNGMQRKFIFALAAMLLASCAPLKIGRISADPSRFQNRTVRVSGTVVNSIGVMGRGGYQIQDDTGKIYVLSTTGVPSKGVRVTVTGTVVPGAQVLGMTVGTAIRERHHNVKD